MKQLLKKIILMILALSILNFANVEAEEKKPLRLVKLPIIFQSAQPDFDTCAALETKLARAVHIPLNGTLKLVEYADTSESTNALNEVWRKMRSENKNAKLKDAIKPLAEKMDADIIVCPLLRRYSEHYFQHGFNLETHLVSDVSATLIVYDRRTDELVEKKYSRSWSGGSNRFGKASYLAGECFDKLIQETKLREKIAEIR